MIELLKSFPGIGKSEFWFKARKMTVVVVVWWFLLRPIWLKLVSISLCSALISGASRAITLSAIQVTHVVFTMQSRPRNDDSVKCERACTISYEMMGLDTFNPMLAWHEIFAV